MVQSGLRFSSTLRSIDRQYQAHFLRHYSQLEPTIEFAKAGSMSQHPVGLVLRVPSLILAGDKVPAKVSEVLVNY